MNIGDVLLVNKKMIRRVADGIIYMKSGREYVMPLYERKKLTEQIRVLLMQRQREA